ncbi:DUF3996 domain-containing protein [Kiritimatiellota bacterium B12222]|nr:DUF3996 domain-containing protein [Kiritimatiellota bacterium B12222]
MIQTTKVFILTVVIAFCGIVNAAPEEGIGMGIIVGEPTGLSLKKWINDTRALDAGIAWSFSGNNSFHLHADYLIHRFDLMAEDAKGQFPLYFGIGARVKFENINDGNGSYDEDVWVGVRVPLGISILFSETPVELFAEIVPVLDLVPDTNFDLNAAVGARYYF